MINLLRIVAILSAVALFVAVCLPYDHPYQIDFPIDHPPIGLILSALASLLVAPLMAISIFGILRFRRWTSKIVVVTAIFVLGYVVSLMVPPSFFSIASTISKILIVFAALLWFLAALLLRRPEIRARFEGRA